MKNIFENSRSCWVRYNRYELKTALDGKRYIMPGTDAKPSVYNPLKEVPGIEKVHRNSIKITVDLWRKRRDLGHLP